MGAPHFRCAPRGAARQGQTPHPSSSSSLQHSTLQKTRRERNLTTPSYSVTAQFSPPAEKMKTPLNFTSAPLGPSLCVATAPSPLGARRGPAAALALKAAMRRTKTNSLSAPLGLFPPFMPSRSMGGVLQLAQQAAFGGAGPCPPRGLALWMESNPARVAGWLEARQQPERATLDCEAGAARL